jgi:hypothetical protein
MAEKLIERISTLLQDQTEEPTKADVTNAVKTYFASKKSAAKSSVKKQSNTDGEAKKREPSAYNVFMREQMAVLKVSENGKEKSDCMSAKAKMQHIASMWKAKKSGEEFVEAPEEAEDAASEEEAEEAEEAPEVEEVPVPVVEVKQRNGNGNGKSSKKK